MIKNPYEIYLDEDKMLEEARMVAGLAHRNQTYDIFPYTKHLNDVERILEEAGFGKRVRVGGQLHDSLEDTGLTYGKLKSAFGKQIAEWVFAVTDPLERTRKEKKAIMFPKLKMAAFEARAIKVADRTANVENSLRMHNFDKLEMYIEEEAEFSQLYEIDLDLHSKEHAYLWERLNRAMEYARRTQTRNSSK
jgi:(p)ppGpp synthase/HD superfamily hydrolase